ncbi:hypothetical protein BH11PLA2_BH11PLA2_37470 [soil metagenome]
MITAARIPATSLPVLAPLRAESRIRIDTAGNAVWIRWPAELTEVLELLRPVRGVEFFEPRPPRWHRDGRRLPSSVEPPSGEGQSLFSLIAPARFATRNAEDAATAPTPWTLQPGGEPQTATAMTCELTPFQAWAEVATSAELQSLKAARSGPRVRLLGNTLPSIAGAARYYGRRLYLPLGYVLAPDLGESLLMASIGLAADELAFLEQDHVDVIPAKVFHPLTRAGVRQVTA